MGITEYEALSFKIFSKLYWYMWSFPVKWNYKASKLEVTKPAWKLIPFTISLLYIWMFGWSFIGTTIYVGYIHERKEFLQINWVMFILFWAVCMSCCLAAYMGLRYAKALISTFNELLQLADEIFMGTYILYHTYLIQINFNV